MGNVSCSQYKMNHNSSYSKANTANKLETAMIKAQHNRRSDYTNQKMKSSSTQSIGDPAKVNSFFSQKPA